MKAFLIFCVFISSITNCHSLLEWLFGEKGESINNNDENHPYDENDVKYEVVTTDKKFQEFANTLTDVNPLDACYNIVVYNLKKKCGELTEDELGKLAVQLFNCQSEAENRPVFPCTSTMTLGECTKNMDATTWNGYQIVGNRARAMCYSAQQITFRKLTEKTVSNLAATAYNHLESMKELKKGQDQIQQLATDTVRKLFESQQDLLTTHESLKIAHQDVFTHVANNVKQLVHEKSLIAAGNKELAEMTENIREKLDKTSEFLQKQEEIQKQNHNKILDDLKEIQKKSHDALKDLSGSTKQLIYNHDEMMHQYEIMFTNLRKMNSSINSLLKTVSDMQVTLETKIGWISSLLGGADDKLYVIMSCIYHVGLFILLVILATFFQIPLLLRSILMVMIVVDGYIEINYNLTLTYTVLTAIMLFTFIAHWIITWVKWRKTGKRFIPRISYSRADNDNEPLSPSELRELSSTLGRLYHSINESLNINTTTENCNGNTRTTTPVPSPSYHHHSPSIITPSPVRLRTSPINTANTSHRNINPIPEESGYSPNISDVRRLLVNQLGDGLRSSYSRSSTPSTSRNSSRASTPTSGKRCRGITRAGSLCRLTATVDNDYCYKHR
ncbi:hypothetical protein LOTGIDRAFT_170634 [Lottia gigantea]|uniref:Protein brambleberry n=1 Tax=Lottia gigantea TaxID=225164 RepID=V4BFC5_LOTGI|nr:hypothetical protein LOTGIDRAFT_170634 [Lottia gigantea]ESP04542.1 hypothetical protein LOTGIDRAFT_170634 [Lottia gigantea]